MKNYSTNTGRMKGRFFPRMESLTPDPSPKERGEETEPADGIVVYPNPSSGTVTVICSENISWVEITDAAGRTVKHVQTNDTGKKADIDIQENGLLLLRVYTANGRQYYSKIVNINAE